MCLYVFYPGVVRYIGPIVGDKKRQYAGLHLDSPGKIIVIPLKSGNDSFLFADGIIKIMDQNYGRAIKLQTRGQNKCNIQV